MQRAGCCRRGCCSPRPSTTRTHLVVVCLFFTLGVRFEIVVFGGFSFDLFFGFSLALADLSHFACGCVPAHVSPTLAPWGNNQSQTLHKEREMRKCCEPKEPYLPSCPVVNWVLHTLKDRFYQVAKVIVSLCTLKTKIFPSLHFVYSCNTSRSYQIYISRCAVKS